jgi:hypothetical protein
MVKERGWNMKAKEKPLKQSLRGVEEILPSIFGQYK